MPHDTHNDDILARIFERVDAIHYAIHGNGEPGLKTRVDRLEQDRERRTYRERLVVGAFVVALAASLATNAVAVVKLSAVRSWQLTQGK